MPFELGSAPGIVGSIANCTARLDIAGDTCLHLDRKSGDLLRKSQVEQQAQIAKLTRIAQESTPPNAVSEIFRVSGKDDEGNVCEVVVLAKIVHQGIAKVSIHLVLGILPPHRLDFNRGEVITVYYDELTRYTDLINKLV